MNQSGRLHAAGRSWTHYIGAMLSRSTSCLVATALCVGAMAVHSDLSARAPSARDLAKRTAVYVQRLDEELVSIVGHERHEQRSVERDAAGPIVEQQRVLDAQVGWVHIPALNDTLAVREVLSKDGTPSVPVSRLQQLLRRPGHALSSTVRQLLDESAVHNLAPGTRNINFPTFALVYLRPENVRRSRWKLTGREGSWLVLAFEERRRPAVVRSPDGHHLWGRGRVWIDAATGRVERTEVRLGGRATLPSAGGPGERASTVRMTYQQEVAFALVDRLNLWLPHRMTDVYDGFRDNRTLRVEGVAVYTDYLRFETAGRLLPHP